MTAVLGWNALSNSADEKLLKAGLFRIFHRRNPASRVFNTAFDGYPLAVNGDQLGKVFYFVPLPAMRY